MQGRALASGKSSLRAGIQAASGGEPPRRLEHSVGVASAASSVRSRTAKPSPGGASLSVASGGWSSAVAPGRFSGRPSGGGGGEVAKRGAAGGCGATVAGGSGDSAAATAAAAARPWRRRCAARPSRAGGRRHCCGPCPGRRPPQGLGLAPPGATGSAVSPARLDSLGAADSEGGAPAATLAPSRRGAVLAGSTRLRPPTSQPRSRRTPSRFSRRGEGPSQASPLYGHRGNQTHIRAHRNHSSRSLPCAWRSPDRWSRRR